jgi:hypothetical protein
MRTALLVLILTVIRTLPGVYIHGSVFMLFFTGFTLSIVQDIKEIMR